MEIFIICLAVLTVTAMTYLLVRYCKIRPIHRSKSTDFSKQFEKNNNVMMNTLLYGYIEDEKSARALLRKNGIFFYKPEYFMTVLIKCEYSFDPKNNIKAIIKENIEAEHFVCYTDNKTIAIITGSCGWNDEFKAVFKSRFLDIQKQLKNRFDINSILSIGSAYKGIFDVSKSYRQALEVIEYKLLTASDDIIYYDELVKRNNNYYYPLSLETKLINAISAAKEADALDIIDTIYEENFEKRQLCYVHIKELIGEINASINKARQNSLSGDDFKFYEPENYTIRAFFEYARVFIKDTCDDIRNFEGVMKNSQFKQMLEFINQNYHRGELSRDMLANEFKLTDITYISKLFKQFSNESFSSYLERIRIEKACELLEKKIPVKDIAVSVGYLNDISFRRAFKKRMGVNPTEYIQKTAKKL